MFKKRNDQSTTGILHYIIYILLEREFTVNFVHVLYFKHTGINNLLLSALQLARKFKPLSNVLILIVINTEISNFFSVLRC